MRAAQLSLVLLALVVAATAAEDYAPYGDNYNPDKNEDPIWKVFCHDTIYGGRVDTIVNPGTFSKHVHRVFGGNNFSPSVASRSAVDGYNVMHASPCTSCSLREVDNSAYWTADLYYRWPNGTYSLVPSGGLTVYYLSRDGPTGGNKTNPNWQPFPKGLRIVAGDPMRRTYNHSLMAHRAIDYVCLGSNSFPQSPDWSGLKTHKCENGLRTQVFFPMCWNGKDLDSPNHADHMSYPIQNPNGGDCPNSHPVRLPGVFFEHIFQVGKFPHGNGENNFLWSMGDTTGYGNHGDFLSGWDPNVVRDAIKHPYCSNNNGAMGNGNNVRACPPLRPYVKDGSEPKCQRLSKPVPLTEDLGISHTIARIPGCYGAEGSVANCDATPKGSDNAKTFFIKTYKNEYLTQDVKSNIIANFTGLFTAHELWAFGREYNKMVPLQNQENGYFASSKEILVGTGNQPSDWEYFTLVTINDKDFALKANRNQKFLSVVGGAIYANATVVGPAETFTMVENNGGYVDSKDDGFNTLVEEKTALEGGSSSASILAIGLGLIALVLF